MPEGSDDPLDRDGEEFVRFDTFGPFPDPTDWHINRQVDVGGPDGITHTGLVFQRADARPQWLTIAYEEDDGGWSATRAAVMGEEGKTVPVTEMPDIISLVEAEEDLGHE